MTTIGTKSPPLLLERNEQERVPVAAKPRKRAVVVLPVVALVAAAVTATLYLWGRDQESTDDAQIEAHVANVSPHVAGQVVRVAVQDNQSVVAGDLLVELDARGLTALLECARADLAAASAELRAAYTTLSIVTHEVASSLIVARGGLAEAAARSGTSRAAIDYASAEIAAAVTRHSLAQSDQERGQRLLVSGALSQLQFDTRTTALDEAEASLAQSRAGAVGAQFDSATARGTIQTARGHLAAAEGGAARIDAASAQVELARAHRDHAQAALAVAELNLSYTKVLAAVSGVVSRRAVEAGQIVSSDRPLLAIVSLQDVWVVANFKEDQLANLRMGQRVEVRVDAFDGQALSGHVESLSSGTGARFSLFPPDNASGNFTKVVQRVPVLIRLDPYPGVVLRPGLSVGVTVFTK